MTKIIFEFEKLSIEGELNDSPTSKALINSLPIEGISQIWGDEIYFSTSISKENDEWAKETVDLGDIAFWPPGNAICLFFGHTPVSLLYAGSVIWLGGGSLLMHGTHTSWGASADNLSMVMYILIPWLFNLSQMGGWSTKKLLII